MILISNYIRATDGALDSVTSLEKIVENMPYGELRNELKSRVRDMKYTAKDIKRNSERMYDNILAFAMESSCSH